MRPGLFLALAAGAALSALPPAAGAYRTGPPAAHTGGFGEGTCAACHWEEPSAGGALRIHAPRGYTPGGSYEIGIVLEDPDIRAAGFQLSARFAAGDAAGKQAGALAATDSCVAVLTAANGIEYASHTEAGAVVVKEGRARWTVRWTAPEEGGDVVFHAAGNAANDDTSELGDRIHTAEARSERAPAGR